MRDLSIFSGWNKNFCGIMYINLDISSVPPVKIQDNLIIKPHRLQVRFHLEPLIDRMHTKTRTLPPRTEAVDVLCQVPVMDRVSVAEHDVADRDDGPALQQCDSLKDGTNRAANERPGRVPDVSW